MSRLKKQCGRLFQERRRIELQQQEAQRAREAEKARRCAAENEVEKLKRELEEEKMKFKLKPPSSERVVERVASVGRLHVAPQSESKYKGKGVVSKMESKRDVSASQSRIGRESRDEDSLSEIHYDEPSEILYEATVNVNGLDGGIEQIQSGLSVAGSSVGFKTSANNLTAVLEPKASSLVTQDKQDQEDKTNLYVSNKYNINYMNARKPLNTNSNTVTSVLSSNSGGSRKSIDVDVVYPAAASRTSYGLGLSSDIVDR